MSYGELLDVFVRSHDVSEAPWSRQYRSAVFVADADERAQAEARLKAAAEKLGRAVHTDIEDLRPFWPAETYHQKYRLQGVPALFQEVQRMYPSEDAFVGSTAAARINGMLAGWGDPAEIDALGLSAEGERILRSRLVR